MRRGESPTILTKRVPLQTRAPAGPWLSTRPAQPFVHLRLWRRARTHYSSAAYSSDRNEMIAGSTDGHMLASTWFLEIQSERDSISKEALRSEPDSMCELL